MTREEAKTKWCPFARTVDSYQGQTYTANRFTDCAPMGGTSCLADRCACWEAVIDDLGHCGLMHR